MRSPGIGGQYRGITEVDYTKLGEAVDSGFQMGTGRAAGGPDRPGREPGARSVRDEIVGGSADDGHVDAVQFGRVLRVWHRVEGEKPRIVWLLHPSPAFGGLDHGLVCSLEAILGRRA